MSEPWHGLAPETADHLRDVLALTRTALDGDTEGAGAVLAALRDEGTDAALDVAWLAAELLARLLADHGGCGGWLAEFQRSHDL